MSLQLKAAKKKTPKKRTAQTSRFLNSLRWEKRERLTSLGNSVFEFEVLSSGCRPNLRATFVRALSLCDGKLVLEILEFWIPTSCQTALLVL
jgi:hypothetical protein